MLDWFLRSLEYCADADEPQRTHETLRVFKNLAATSEGCRVMLLRGVPEKLCCVLYLDQPTDIVENALWTLGNIAGEGRAAVDSLIERGVFAHVCRYMADVYGGTVHIRAALHNVLSWTVSNFLRVTPPLPFRVTVTALPQLFFALRRFPAARLTDALKDVLWSLSFVFRKESVGVRFEYLFVDDDDIFLRILAQLHVSRELRTPALRIAGIVASLFHGEPDRAFTPPALAHLQRFARSLGPTDTEAMM